MLKSQAAKSLKFPLKFQGLRDWWGKFHNLFKFFHSNFWSNDEKYVLMSAYTEFQPNTPSSFVCFGLCEQHNTNIHHLCLSISRQSLNYMNIRECSADKKRRQTNREKVFATRTVSVWGVTQIDNSTWTYFRVCNMRKYCATLFELDDECVRVWLTRIALSPLSHVSVHFFHPFFCFYVKENRVLRFLAES